MAGYSGTPLAKKLGIASGATIAILHAPDAFSIELPDAVTVRSQLRGRLDVCLAFFVQATALTHQWTRLTAAMTKSGGIWVAWPKKSSGVPTDITEQTLRDIVLPTGWVDNKVCAIDETWSGLRFVLRRELR